MLTSISLKDTTRNLRHVDQMLGRYREYSTGQAGAVGQLKEDLEQSINQLRSQRLRRSSGGRSVSVTSLSASDLDGGAVTENLRFAPTSPLKDYDLQGIKRNRFRTGVRFVSETDDMVQLHTFHQSLRDLSSEQVRLGDDLNRELFRRSRSDAETKRVLEELTGKLNEVQKPDVVSDRVERRLQEIEREMRLERELVERRHDQLGLVSLKLQEDRVNALQMSTRVALDHLESVPEKLSLLEDFKDFRGASSLSEKTDGRYSKYSLHGDSVQQRRDDTKPRIKSFRDDRPLSAGSHAHGLDHSSSCQDHSRFLSSPQFSHSLPVFTKRTIATDPASIEGDTTSLPANGTSPQSKKEEHEIKKYKK